MSSEFIVDKEDSSGSGPKESYVNMILIGIIVVLLIGLFMNNYGGDCAAYFQGPFFERSDVGADAEFDLQGEIDYLNEQQMNNLGNV